jgi:dienelactone hydrolase
MSYPGQQPPGYGYPGQNYPGQGYPGSSLPPSSAFGPSLDPPPPRPGGSGSPWLWIVLAILGVGGLSVVLCCGVSIYALVTPPAASAAAKAPFNVAAVPPPAFTDRGPPQPLGTEEGNVVVHTISLGPTGGYYNPPGHGGAMYLYLPPGQHPPGSLPCVLITGAGTNLLYGYEFGGDPSETGDAEEFLPYAKAGMAVLAYELDGPTDDGTHTEAEGYMQFCASCAGLVNARNALEYVLAKVPEVNPKQIFVAGHSSAATTALLFAEHETRLAGCVAYAPCSDLSDRFPGFLIRMLQLEMPGLADFIVQSSPRTHESRLSCPLFLFHAEDDSNVSVEESKGFAKRLQAVGKDVTLKTVPTGDHYDSMIEEGIPAGIAWIKQRTGRP